MANVLIADDSTEMSALLAEYIKKEAESISKRYKFYEIDTVQVKGKTQGKKIYFPFDTNEMEKELLDKYEIFETGLQAYYDGDWKTARKQFKNCELPELTEVFLERMGNKSAPEGWNGIWTMTTK